MIRLSWLDLLFGLVILFLAIILVVREVSARNPDRGDEHLFAGEHVSIHPHNCTPRWVYTDPGNFGDVYCDPIGGPPSTPQPTTTAVPSPTPTSTAGPTATPLPPTPTPTRTSTPTPSPTPTVTSTSSPTMTPTPGGSVPTPTPTSTVSGCLVVTQANAVIQNLTIRNCGGIGIDVRVNGVTIRNVTLEGNEKNIRFLGVTGGLVENSTLRNPRNSDGDYDQQIGLNTSNNITVRNNVMTCTSPCQQEDAIGIWYSDGARILDNTITGGNSGSGCGVMNDSGSDNTVIIGNTISNQTNCGVGIANGRDVLVQGNTVLAPIGNVAFYAENYGDLACGPNIRFVNNTTNVANAYWTGGGCGTITGSGNSWGDDLN